MAPKTFKEKVKGFLSCAMALAVIPVLIIAFMFAMTTPQPTAPEEDTFSTEVALQIMERLDKQDPPDREQLRAALLLMEGGECYGSK